MRGSGVVLFLASAALLAAADPTPADPEAAAKKDLAAIRSTVAPSDPAAALPSLNLQEVGPLPAAEHPAPSLLLAPEGELGPDGLKKKKEGTGNWLVDAMERDQKADKAAAPGRDRDDLLKSDGDLVRGDEKGVTRPEKEGQPFDQSREKAEAAVAAAPVYNPLESFMSSWISAKDHDLLLPAKAEAGLGEAARTRGDQGLELGPANPAEDLLPAVDPASEAKAGPNPYLAELDQPPPPVASGFAAPVPLVFAPADLAEGPRAPAASGVDPRPDDPVRTFIPDFAQPSDDDRYFKQLKKF